MEVACIGTGVSEMCAADKEGSIYKQLLEEILHATKDRSSFRRLDPAHCGSAEKEWSHLLEEIEISDPRLRQTHDKVAERFNLGSYHGQLVADLVNDFESGAAKPEQLTPLEARRTQYWEARDARKYGV